MVFPGLPRYLRWGRFRRISAQTQAGNGAGVCRASLATFGFAGCVAGRQQRSVWLTSHPGSLNRFVRLVLLVGIELTFIPEHEPWRNGSIEQFNGWLQERLFSITLHSPAQVRRELRAMMETCFHEHIHPDLNFQTTAQVQTSLPPAHLAAQFSSASATAACRHRSRDVPSARTHLGTHHRPGCEIQNRQTVGSSICLGYSLHSYPDPQNLFAGPSDQAIRFSVRWQAPAVSNHLALIFLHLSSALIWRTAI